MNCLIAAAYLRRRRQRIRRKKYHIHPILLDRTEYGEFHVLFEKLRQDEVKFFNYLRMSVKSFDELFTTLEDHLKHCSLFRQVISPKERLVVTLR